ncbi:MAG TPA: AAA family ATPase [Acidimicrobiales bacterium]|nr:AAA family ATPase [Acidimicrobiales bacterium]
MTRTPPARTAGGADGGHAQEWELAQLRRVLFRAAAGDGGSVVVDGPPDSGKSSLIAQALSSGPRMPLLVLSGLQAESPYDGAALSRMLSTVSARLRLRDAAPGGRAPAGVSLAPVAEVPESGLLELSSQLTRDLVSLAGELGLTVVADDAQWLDRLSLDVIGFVARRLAGRPIAMLIATTDFAGQARSLAGITRLELRARPAAAPEGIAGKVAVSLSTGPDGSAPLAAAGVEIRMLGGFEVRRNGVLTGPHRGLPTQALKVIALRRRLTVDELEELLWPKEPSSSLTRGRVRTLIYRVRTTYGPVVERLGDEVRLAAGVSVDAHVFEERAARLQAADLAGDRKAAARAEALVAGYGGELLPADRQSDWTREAREQLSRRFLQVVDMAEAAARSAGDLERALRLNEEAIRMDPYDEERYLRAARLLSDHGAPSRALAILTRSRAATARLGLPPSSAVDELARRIRAGAGG